MTETQRKALVMLGDDAQQVSAVADKDYRVWHIGRALRSIAEQDEHFEEGDRDRENEARRVINERS